MAVRMSRSSSGLTCARLPRRRRAGLSCLMSDATCPDCAADRPACALHVQQRDKQHTVSRQGLDEADNDSMPALLVMTQHHRSACWQAPHFVETHKEETLVPQPLPRADLASGSAARHYTVLADGSLPACILCCP